MKLKHNVLERHYANMFFHHNRIMWLNASDILACHSKKSTGVENISIMATLDLGVSGFWISVSQQTIINNWDTRMDPLCYLSTHVFLLCDNSKLSAHTIICHVGYIPNIWLVPISLLVFVMNDNNAHKPSTEWLTDFLAGVKSSNVNFLKICGMWAENLRFGTKLWLQ